MFVLKKGQKIKLGDYISDGAFSLEITAKIVNAETDITCFGVDSDGKLSDDRYFVFYNQPSSPENAITMQASSEKTTFFVDRNKLPSSINKLVFSITADGSADMSGISIGTMKLKQNGADIEAYEFSGSDFSHEKAVILCEIYNKDNVWRMSMVASGFNGGLSALLSHFGGEEVKPDSGAGNSSAEEINTVPINAAEQKQEQNAEPKKGKVSLKKSGDSHKISLKKDGGNKAIHVNLNWDNITKGFLGVKSSVDLDLACMFKLKNGMKGVIQALGNSFGSKDFLPFIFLDGDDRSGNAAKGENMYFYKPETIEFAVVFAYIYEGVPNWGKTNAVVTIKQEGESDIEVDVSSKNTKDRFCVIASFKDNGNGLTVTKEEKYFPGHREVDKNYGFGFSWVAGRK